MKNFKIMTKLASMMPFKQPSISAARLATVGVFMAVISFAVPVNAAVYKTVDADGNVSFSDVPNKTAEVVDVQPISTIQSLSPDQIANALSSDDDQKADSKSPKYTLTILSPAPGQTFQRASDAFSANVKVKPDLKNGDHLELLVDGKSASNTDSLQMAAGDLDRGSHQLDARVVNKNGRVLATQSVTFYVQQPNVHQERKLGLHN